MLFYTWNQGAPLSQAYKVKYNTSTKGPKASLEEVQDYEIQKQYRAKKSLPTQMGVILSYCRKTDSKYAKWIPQV